MVNKCDFPHVAKIPYQKKRILVIFMSIFSTQKNLSNQGWLFRNRMFKKEYFKEKMSSVACLRKKLFTFPQKYWFGPFLAT